MHGSAADALEERSACTVTGAMDGEEPFVLDVLDAELEDAAILGALGEAARDASERYVGLRSRDGVLCALAGIRLDDDGVEEDMDAAACKYIRIQESGKVGCGMTVIRGRGRAVLWRKAGMGINRAT